MIITILICLSMEIEGYFRIFEFLIHTLVENLEQISATHFFSPSINVSLTAVHREGTYQKQLK
jgi:hypothetical protein